MELARNNLKAFYWFRLLFNCRFYYPIYAVLFLDFGIDVAQFALLNAIWAVTIVLLEVPSGAVADQIGRRKLVVFAAWLMCLELALICLAPVGGGTLLFVLLALNRVLSGAAEAAASGADEALAYDSLPERGRTRLWARFSGKLMRAMSVLMAVVFLLGGLLFDPLSVRALFGLDGPLWGRDASVDFLKWPLYATWAMSFGAIYFAYKFTEIEQPTGRQQLVENVKKSFARVAQAGLWIVRSKAVFVLIVLAVFFDAWARLVIVNNSQIYRLMAIPESLYGLLGAFSAALGVWTSAWVVRLHEKRSIDGNFLLIWLLLLTTLVALLWPLPYVGFVFLFPIGFVLRMVAYFLSQYLNEITPRQKRATVLSFKGLALNLGFGIAMLAFAFEVHLVEEQGWQSPQAVLLGSSTELEGELARAQELGDFAAAIALWLPAYLLFSLLLWWALKRAKALPLTGIMEAARARLRSVQKQSKE